jgi:RNA polymerase sigma factor (TIGR02999 family)
MLINLASKTPCSHGLRTTSNQSSKLFPTGAQALPENHDQLNDLFSRLRTGDVEARNELYPLVYAELHRMASHAMAHQSPTHTLQATALVNEAYIRMCGSGHTQWSDRVHFLRLSGRVMRQVLVDHARAKQAIKREKPAGAVELDSVFDSYEHRSGGLIALDDALTRLEERDPALVQIVELHFFVGHPLPEVASILNMSSRTVDRRWQAIKLFLKGELEK